MPSSPDHVELTTLQAAEALNVSHSYLVSLLEEGLIPFRKVAAGCLVLSNDLMAYKSAEDAKRLDALNELTRQAQELGLGY